MNCTTAKRMFSEAFDDRLTTPVRLRFEEHVSECDPCDAAFRGYQSLFSAVRSMPSTHTDLPAPVPESAGSFIARGGMSRLTRRVAAAAIIVLVAGASFAGFQYGKTNRGPESGETTGAEVAEVEYPSKPGGKALRRVTNSFSALATAYDHVSRDPHPRAIEAVNRAAGQLPIHADAARLAKMDSNSLGSFTEPIHDFAGEAMWLSENVIEALRSSPGDAADRLAAFRKRMEMRDVERKIALMRKITRPYDTEPLPGHVRTEGNDFFVLGLRAFVDEDHDEAMRFLGRALESAELGKLAEVFHGHLRGRGIRHGRRLEFHHDVELPEGLRFLTPHDIKIETEDGKVQVIIKSRDIRIERGNNTQRPKKRL